VIAAVHDAPVHTGAGQIRSALGAPIGPRDRPRAIGPFAVFIHALPLEIAAGTLPPDFDVRPHPHIGLAAISYLMSGYLTHRDSLGSRVELGPGGLGFMVAGRGVVHSERFDRLRTLGGTLELLQLLLALPDGHEDCEPSFLHTAEVAAVVDGGATVRALHAACRFPAPLLCVDVQLAAGGRHVVAEEHPERAIYVVDGEVEIDGQRVAAQQTAVLGDGPARVVAAQPARVVAFGGEPVGPRYSWWNYIHSSLHRLADAKAAWRGGAMARPPGDTEAFTPAPPDDGRPLLKLNAP
jgi:hypothetical protein